jgi:Ca2+-binding RTX toxin-like protein
LGADFARHARKEEERMPFSNTETGGDAFILTAANPRHLSGAPLTLTQATAVQAFTSMQYTGVQFWAVDATNAQLLQSGAAFTGYRLTPDNQAGLTNVSLPAGQWWVGAVYANQLSGSQSVAGFDELSLLTYPGQNFVNNVPMPTNGNPGAWQGMAFSIAGNPNLYLEAVGSGGKYVVMTDAQFFDFSATYAHGYTGGGYSGVYAFGGTSGVPASQLEGQLQLTPGNYELVWLNDTSSWQGGAANISAYSSAGGSLTGLSASSSPPPSSPPPPSGPVSLQATDGNASLVGGAGDDTLMGYSGQDTLFGGDGNDSIVGGADFNRVNGNRGDDTIIGHSVTGDWLLGGQGNDLIDATGSTGHNIINGNLGNDTMRGGDYGDTLRGGQGDDTIVAGAGNDLIFGDLGNNTITGGGGADTFHGGNGAALDVITDFHRSEGDQVQIGAGLTYQTSQSGADVRIDVSNGDVILLKNTSLDALNADSGWIFQG